jgi:hypothetical protein
MSNDEQSDQQMDDDEDTQPFAKEADLREEHDHEVLGGCDVEHCQRMRG